MTPWTRLVLLSCLAGAGGCASDLARASSSAIGCPTRAIEISSISVGWATTSWRAVCRDVAFYCSGDGDAVCSPELTAASATTQSPPTPKETSP